MQSLSVSLVDFSDDFRKLQINRVHSLGYQITIAMTSQFFKFLLDDFSEIESLAH